MHEMLCRQASGLVNESKEASYHEVHFDGSGVASGVDLYRLQAGNFIRTNRFFLVK